MDLGTRGHASARSQCEDRTLGPVHVPSALSRRRALRWFAPVVVVGVAVVFASGVLHSAPAPEKLPAMTPRALIAAVRTTDSAGFSGGFSGTVVSRISLGLPEVPSVSTPAGGNSSSLTSLLTGAHTLQVWYGGPRKQRVAVLGATDETDLFRSGSDLWEWNSADRVATHAVVPDADRRITAALTDPTTRALTLTPSNLADELLSAIGPSTKVRVRSGLDVAGRSAYQMVLTPRSNQSLIGSVRIALDGHTKIPLGVQVYARGATSPSVDISFTSINYGRPYASSFRFAPPAGATVKQVHLARTTVTATRRSAVHTGSGATALFGESATSGRAATVTGSSWTTVVSAQLPKHSALRASKGLLAEAFVPVSGTWGAGRLLQTDLADLLVLNNGRAYAGAVQPAVLYAAAGRK